MLKFMTANATALLGAFDDAIAKGHIETWDKLNGYYGHLAQQWKSKAFFHASVQSDGLLFELILVPGNLAPYEGRAVFAAYHGHLLSTFQRHFYFRFEQAMASPGPSLGDAAIP